MSKSEQLKEQGNKAFGQGDYQKAIQYFTEAIKLEKSAIYFSNRASCYIKLNNFQAAIQDTAKAYEIDPNYQKGAQKHVECLIKLSKFDQAVIIAERLFNTEQTSKNRELLNEAQKAMTLTGNDENSFKNKILLSAKQLLILTAQATKVIFEGKFPMISSAERCKDVKKADQFEMDQCDMIEKLSNFRDNLVTIGMKQLQEDHDFIKEHLPNYVIDNDSLAFYFLLIHNFRITTDAFAHYGLQGFPCDEEIHKNKNYFLDKSTQFNNMAKSGLKKQILQICVSLQKQNIDQAVSQLSQVVKSENQFMNFVQQYQNYNSLKEKGTQEYKSSLEQSINTFHQATKCIFDYEQLSISDPNTIDPYQALLYLAAQYLASQTLSNEGMAFNKLNQNEKALARLSAATFLDQTYEKAHRRAGQIYYDANMFLEAEREYAFAVVLKQDQQITDLIKDCQNKLKPHLRKDYYAILEVDKNIDTTSDDYNRKYKRICAKWHPDRYARDPVMKRFAQIKFRQIQEADDVLRDKNKRAIFDQGGDPINQGGQGGMGGFNFGGMGGMGGIDISDIIGQMFGGGMGGMPGGFSFSVNGQEMHGGRQQRQGGRRNQGGMPPGFPSNFFEGFM